MIEKLQAAVDEAGGYRQFAEKHRLSFGYVGEVLRGSRLPAHRICATIGYEPVTVYREVKP